MSAGRQKYRPVGTCPECGKLRFLTRKDARAHSKENLPSQTFSIYRCGDFWHFGHKPYLVARGVIAREDI